MTSWRLTRRGRIAVQALASALGVALVLASMVYGWSFV